MAYSQSTEEQIILDYFGDKTGTLLSLGENDGETFSNSKALIEKGWVATLFEPSPEAFKKLIELHQWNPNIVCIEKAVSNFNGKTVFFHSGEHIGKGDISLLSTLKKEETKRWGDTAKFEEIEVDCIDFKKLLELSPYKTFDFISIDCEGVEIDILKQMNFDELETKLLCVENNGKDEDKFNEIIIPFGFTIIHRTAENLIYAK